jgi:hypothetical protein
MPLTWHLLPEPIVLRMLQHAGGALVDRLASAVLVLRAVSTAGRLCRCWQQLEVKALAGGDLTGAACKCCTCVMLAEAPAYLPAFLLLQDLFASASTGASAKPGSLPGAAAASAAVPGPVFRHVLAELQPDVEALLATMEGLVEACAGKCIGVCHRHPSAPVPPPRLLKLYCQATLQPAILFFF